MTDAGSPLVPPHDARVTPEAIASRSFSLTKRGYVETEVRAYLRMVADEYASVVSRERDLAYRVQQLEERLHAPTPPPTDQELITALGEETARVLGQARESALELRGKAEEHARRVVKEAQDTARELRTTAQQTLEQKTREAEDVARARANEIVGEARNLRERVLTDLSERREELERQIAELRGGRGKLVEAYELVDRALAQVTQLINDETSGYVAPRVTPTAPEPSEEGEPAAAVAVATATDAARVDVEPAAAAEPAPAAEPERATVTEAEPAASAPSEEPTVVAEPPAPAETADDAAPGDHGGAGAPAAPAKDVGALFDQLRSATGSEGAAPSDDEALGFAESRGEGATSATSEADQRLLAQRDAVIEDVSDDLSRRAKRALQDEQNDILDGVRRLRGKIDPGRVLPSLDEQVSRWAHVLQPGVDAAYAAGSASAGGSARHAPGPLLSDLSATMVTPLRDRLGATLAAVDEPTPADTEIAIASGLGARYREWRTQHLDPLLGDTLAAAYARGVYDAAPAGARLRWVPPVGGTCADCDDNSLEPTLRGDDFPTGQPHPPAHPGCRCLLVVE
jgi:DivIVA domain-containing protein